MITINCNRACVINILYMEEPCKSEDERFIFVHWEKVCKNWLISVFKGKEMNLFMNMLISVYQRCYQRSFLGNFSRKWALWYTIRTMFLPSQITSRQLKLFLYKILLLSNFANPYAVFVLHLFDRFLFFFVSDIMILPKLLWWLN